MIVRLAAVLVCSDWKSLQALVFCSLVLKKATVVEAMNGQDLSTARHAWPAPFRGSLVSAPVVNQHLHRSDALIRLPPSYSNLQGSRRPLIQVYLCAGAENPETCSSCIPGSYTSVAGSTSDPWMGTRMRIVSLSSLLQHLAILRTLKAVLVRHLYVQHHEIQSQCSA